MKIKQLKLTTLLLGIFLSLCAITCVFPFIYMLFTSFKTTYSLTLDFDITGLTLGNYVTIFNNFDFFRYFFNSSFIVFLACFLNILISSLAAYGFEKKKFKGSEILFGVYIATLMLPQQVILIPLFIVIRKLHLLNTHIALALPIVNAFGVFLVRQFMKNIPDELIEAARIDGCSELKIFFRIIFPLIKSVLLSLTVFTFITTWNDFAWPLVATTNVDMSTLTLALSSLQGNYLTNYGLVMAGATITFLPAFTLYIFLQKQFVEGISLSGVKG